MAILQKSKEATLYIKLGEEIIHPIYGRMKVTFIHEQDGEDYCTVELRDFKDTVRVFNAHELARVKFKVFQLAAVKETE